MARFLLPTVGTDQDFLVLGGTTGTQPTFGGDDVFDGSYVRTGSHIHFRINVSFANIITFGTGQYYVDLPFPAKYSYQFTAGCVHDIGVSESDDYLVSGHVFKGESRVYLKSIDKEGNSVVDIPFTSTEPFTLAATDNFHISGDYIKVDDVSL